MTKRVDDLVRLICPPPEGALAPVLRAWCGASRTFLAFVEGNATKIRRKARLAPSEDELGDLLAELGVAGLLVREGRVTLRYEPFASGGTRGADFEGTLPSGAVLRVEVTRPRTLDADDPQGSARRLARVMRDKLGQFPAGAATNVVALVVADAAFVTPLVPVPAALLRPPGRATNVPGALEVDARLRARLGAVAVCEWTPSGTLTCASLWLNPDARHRVEAPFVRLFGGALVEPGAPGA